MFFFIRIIIILLTIGSFIEFVSRKVLAKKKSREEFDKLKERGKTKKVGNDDRQIGEKLYQNRNIKGEKVEVKGVYNEDTLQFKNYKDIVRELGGFKIKKSDYINFVVGREYKVEGIFDGKYLYVTKVANEHLIDRVNGLEELEVERSISKDLIVNPKSYIKGKVIFITLIISSLLAYFYLAKVTYFILLSIIGLISLLPKRKEVVKIYGLEGVYNDDGALGESIGGIIIKGFGKGEGEKLDYKSGEYVFVEGFKDGEVLKLIKYRGFSFYETLVKINWSKVLYSNLIIVFTAVMSLSIYMSKEFKEYRSYREVSKGSIGLVSVEDINNQVEVGQYVDLSRMGFYIAKDSEYSNDYYLLEDKVYDLGSYREKVEGVDEEIKKHKTYLESINIYRIFADIDKYSSLDKLEKLVEDPMEREREDLDKYLSLWQEINHKSVVDSDELKEQRDSITSEGSKVYEGIEEHKVLTQLYTSEKNMSHILLAAYRNFVEALINKENVKLVKLENEISKVYESNIIVRGLEVEGNSGFHHSYVDLINPSSIVAKVLDVQYFDIKGFVSEVDEKGGKLYLSIDSGRSRNELEKSKWLYSISFMYLLIALIYVGVIINEVIRVIKYRRFS